MLLLSKVLHDQVHVHGLGEREHVRVGLVEALLSVPGNPLRRVNVQLLVGIHGDQDGAREGVDLVARISRAQVDIDPLVGDVAHHG